MARHEIDFTPAEGDADAEDPAQPDRLTWQGFPETAIADKPGHEREYTLDRIERTIGSIL